MDFIKCPYCGETIYADSTRCPNCRHSLPPKLSRSTNAANFDSIPFNSPKSKDNGRNTPKESQTTHFDTSSNSQPYSHTSTTSSSDNKDFIKCPYCGETIYADSTRCPNCRHSLPPKLSRSTNAANFDSIPFNSPKSKDNGRNTPKESQATHFDTSSNSQSYSHTSTTNSNENSDNKDFIIGLLILAACVVVGYFIVSAFKSCTSDEPVSPYAVTESTESIQLCPTCNGVGTVFDGYQYQLCGTCQGAGLVNYITDTNGSTSSSPYFISSQVSFTGDMTPAQQKEKEEENKFKQMQESLQNLDKDAAQTGDDYYVRMKEIEMKAQAERINNAKIDAKNSK